MSARRTIDVRTVTTVVTAAALTAAVFLFALSEIAHPSDMQARLARATATLSDVEASLQSPGDADAYPPHALCRMGANAAGPALQDRVTALAAGNGLTLTGVSATPGVADETAGGIAPVSLQFQTSGRYDAVIGFMGALARNQPEIFADSVDLKSETSAVSLTFEGRIQRRRYVRSGDGHDHRQPGGPGGEQRQRQRGFQLVEPADHAEHHRWCGDQRRGRDASRSRDGDGERDLDHLLADDRLPPGSDGFQYTATNATATSSAATVSITVKPQGTLVANNVGATVAFGSSNNAITLTITGGTATSVAVSSQPSHGTAAASGTAITYTPGSGYSGSDSFQYTASNAGGASAPGTVFVTVNPAPVTKTVVIVAGTTSWVVPSDWNSANNMVQVIGPGGNGGGSLGSPLSTGSGGGGGQFAQINNVSLTPGAVVSVQVGGGGSQSDTWFLSSTTVRGQAGQNATSASGTTTGSGTPGSGGSSRREAPSSTTAGTAAAAS